MEKQNSKKINVLLWGFGYMNKLVMRYLLEKNYSLAGVITRSNIGEDPYIVADLENYKNENQEIKITSCLNAEETLKEMSPIPDVCILSTKSDLKEIYNELKLLAKSKINVVTLAEELFYPLDSSPELIKEIDYLFKENNVSLVGTGIQDYFHGSISAALINSCHKVDKISINAKFNEDEFGGRDGMHPYGKSKEAYYEKCIDNLRPINFFITQWLAAMFNWKVIDHKYQFIPILSKLDKFESKNFGVILKDQVIGEIAEVTSKCENGVLIVHSLEAVVFHSESDIKLTSWKIEGEPSFEIVCNNPPGPKLICAAAVNRILHLLNSNEKGYIPTFKFGFSSI